MKSLIKLAVATLLVTGLMTPLALAQGKTPEEDDEVRSRAIRPKVEKGEMDGIEVTVYMVDGKNLVAIDPGRNFKNGDKIRVEFWSSFDGYVYFVNVPPSGKKAVIYPFAEAKHKNNIIRAGQRYMLPHGSEPFVFDDEKGVEVIQVIMSRQPIDFLEDAIKNSKGELGETASNAADEIVNLGSKRSGIDSETSVKVLPQNKSDDLLSRGEIRLARPRSKEEKGTIIAIPDGLKNGRIAVVEVRLKHI